MKLSNFPYLIQKEVLDHLSINQLFFFSLCSKNTKNFIKETQKRQLKKVERLTYYINGHICIRVKMANKRDASRVMYFERHEENSFEQVVRVKELTTPVDFLRCIRTVSDLYVKYCPDTLESIMESIHNQLYDVFGNDTKFWLDGLNHSSTEGTPFLPLLENIQKVDVLQKGLDPTKVDKFLDRSTCLEHFSWDTSSIQLIQLRENSKLYDLDTVYVSSFECPMASDVLKRFNGRHAFLRGKIDTSDVIQFLNEWKSGEKFKNLELVSLAWRRFDLLEICDSVDLWAVNREVKHSFNTKFEEKVSDYPYLSSGEFKSRFFAVRESDGHVASLLMAPKLIMMGVWNMTEKEFLNKFN